MEQGKENQDDDVGRDRLMSCLDFGGGGGGGGLSAWQTGHPQKISVE